jgi:torulene dioxygenase
MRDSDGREWFFELPTVSPATESPTPVRHRYAYGWTGFTYRPGSEQDPTESLVYGPHGAVVKVDADAAAVLGSSTASPTLPSTTAAASVLVWSDASIHPSEPLFVPSPGGVAEDEGVLLVLGYDLERRESLLLVLDAQSMTELARAYTGGTRIPPSFHGQWIPAEATV